MRCRWWVIVFYAINLSRSGNWEISVEAIGRSGKVRSFNDRVDGIVLICRCLCPIFLRSHKNIH